MIFDQLNNIIKGHIITNKTRFHKEEYLKGEIDTFVHLDMKTLRNVAKENCKTISKNEFHKLITHQYHEFRLVALLILINQINDDNLKEIYDKYDHYIQYVNNWDLVDVSAPSIVGAYVEKYNQYKVLLNYADSNDMWINRIATVSCLYLIRKNQLDEPLKIIEKLLTHDHDLMHKANGWMLREVGKKDRQLLNEFIKKHYEFMPRTTLRYAIERHDTIKRKKILGGNLEWI
ncbi:MAG: DNA alkylation repair protein [Tenericutes bacterium]|jgi:3-methyladenine DNA glycosylase AlkD|nr:DNA alkylation repair protein [Mycoplasmatota bacterium]